MKLTWPWRKRRWDSSDPDRAPPPLPLNPGVSSPVTKPNTSATVAAAAEAIASRMRESQYVTNLPPEKSPEKSLMKGQYHKRMQSIQGNSSVRDLSSYLENSRSTNRSPERSPERARTPLDFENKLAERSPTRSGTPTPMPKDPSKDAPTLRPSSRPPLKAILGESSPQSATMRALQATPTDERDALLPNAANTSNSLIRTPPSFDAISSQILSLTTIATNLQREMAQLSRRSKDNAMDLNNLKDATNARDEDIRKSLRDLVANLNTKSSDSEGERMKGFPFNRSSGPFYLEDKVNTSPNVPKSISLPRIPSPASFSASLDRELIATTPNPYSVDGAAAIALLEKILREMGTKEGQERLVNSLSELVERTPSTDSSPNISKQLEDIMKLLKESPDSRALVRAGPSNATLPKASQMEYDYATHPAVALARAGRSVSGTAAVPPGVTLSSNTRAIDVLNDDVMKLLKRMKDSITEGGGMSAEIKALVRELRGEVLGMGREIGRKLEQAESTSKNDARPYAQGPGREEVARIVEEGLAELREHMDHVMREHRRQSSSSITSRNAVDTQEVYAVVKNALGELRIPEPNQGRGIEREEILEAVREAWETYKPEIELQNFGLERDEILECLKEGLQDYKSQDAVREIHGASFEEVLDAVKMGLQDFKPPMPVETEASITREEIIVTVRECLESFEFPTNSLSREREPEITREDVFEAVKEGLLTHAPLSKELGFNREDLFDAVRAGLEVASTPMNGVGEQVLDKMQDLIEGMRGEFQQYSAANGRDTEQVLDAMKDGLEVLRASIETYVDRASDVTGKDEIVETVKVGLENLRIDLEGTIANSRGDSGPTSSAELLDVMEKEFEHLRVTISSSVTRGESSVGGREELLDAIREGFDELKDSSSRSLVGGTMTEDSVKEELRHLRETLATTIIKGGDSIDREEILETIREGIDRMQLEKQASGRTESIVSNTSELLDAFHEGLDGLKADVERVINKEGLEGIRSDIERVLSEINKPIDMTVNYEILEMLKDGLASVRADIDRLATEQTGQMVNISSEGREVVVADENPPKAISQPDIENLEVMITQLKIKVEALDNQPPVQSAVPEDAALKGDVARLEEMLKELQTTITVVASRDRSAPEDAAKREDVNAIETILMNTKAKLDEMIFPDTKMMARAEQFDSLEVGLKDAKDSIDDLRLRYEDTAATKEDIGLIEAIVKELQAGFEDIREKAGEDSIRRPDIEALEALCVDTQTQMREIVPEGESVASKANVHELQTLVKEFHERTEAFQEKVAMDADMTAQAFEARKIEHGGIADKIEEVKGFLDDVRVELKSKIEGSGQGIEGIAITLTALGEALTAASSAENIKEMKETLEGRLDQLQESHESARSDLEAHRDNLLGKHDEHKSAIVDELRTKIDARFDEIMTKYDDAQLSSNAKAAALDEKSNESKEAITSTKMIAEDLKLLIDTLGLTVTESCGNISEDSKTVFNKVEDLASKLDNGFTALTADGKEDHQLTRTELSKTAVLVESLQANIAEHNPKLLAAVNDVFSIISRHFEDAQKSTEEIKTSVREIPNTFPALPAPVASPTEERVLQLPEKYDDSEVHDKLDRLFELTAEAGKTAVEFDVLEQIKSQVTKTALDLESFVKSQLALTADAQESRAREAEEAAIALEKRVAQKEVVEGDAVRLQHEKTKLETSVSDLATSVESLRQEEKEMMSLKAKLQAELSSIETALRIRREEMHIMESRAERLEKRIIEGVMDHSRALLLSSKPQTSLNAMNLKRVASAASSNLTAVAADTKSTKSKTLLPTKPVPSAVPSAVSSAVGKALKKRQAPSATGSPSSNTRTNRRILSLSTISGNKAASNRSMGLAEPSALAKHTLTNSAGGLKRSHSAKSNFPSRKSSWNGSKQIGLYGDNRPETDKENSVLEEEEEEGSDGGTERRSSFTGTYATTDFGAESYATESATDSAVDDRRMSFAASSTVGTLGTGEPSVLEDDDAGSRVDEGQSESEGQESDGQMQLYTGDAVHERDLGDGTKNMVLYPSDSGLGTEPPTAALDGGGAYFRAGGESVHAE
ncbi:MAG: hypothetical protein LQ340_003168 [Diploschistes diacapsis]|nr:MAG: hypothetical protein LQ340_003168 [Diploschistes diacapsis]